LYIERGGPWQNGYAESFGSKLRDELLNAEVFENVPMAKALGLNWRLDDNHRRPHCSLGYRTPAAFAASLADRPVAPLPSGSTSNAARTKVILSSRVVTRMGAGQLCEQSLVRGPVPPDCPVTVVSGHVRVSQVCFADRRILIDTTGGTLGDLSRVLLPEREVVTSSVTRAGWRGYKNASTIGARPPDK
jgi:hypothetical protein